MQRIYKMACSAPRTKSAKSTSYTSVKNEIMKYCLNDVSETWSNIALRNLIRDSPSGKALLEVLRSENELSGCVTVGSKALPSSSWNSIIIMGAKWAIHVASCKMFRWPYIDKPHEVEPIESCVQSFISKTNKICINPYHYKKTKTAATCYGEMKPFCDLNRLMAFSPHIRDYFRREMVKDVQSDVSYVPDDDIDSEFYSDHEHDSEEDDLMLQVKHNHIIDYGRRRNCQGNEEHRTQTDLKPGENYFFNHQNLHGVLNSKCDKVNASFEHSNRIRSSRYVYSPDTLVENTSTSGLFSGHNMNEVNRRSLEQRTNMVINHRVGNKEPWACLSYYERTCQVGPSFYARAESVTVDGMSYELERSRFHYSVGSLQGYFSKDPEVTIIKEQICKGMKLEYKDGDVYATCLSRKPVFIHSYLTNRVCEFHPNKVVCLSTGDSLLVSSSSDFEAILQEKYYEGHMALLRTSDFCNMSISFGKGWGIGYSCSDITKTSCWLRICFYEQLSKLKKLLEDIRKETMMLPPFYDMKIN